MGSINSRAAALKPSETLAVKAKAEELKAKGRTILDLSAGEPEIDTPEHIKEATHAALRDGKTKYTAVNGILPLREAIAAKLQRENNLSYSPNDIIVTNGGKQALQAMFEVSLEAGDEVVIPAPYWVSYPAMVELAGGKPVIVRPESQDSFRLTPQDLKRAISSKTKWVILNSPSNPNGLGYSRDEQVEFGKIISSTNAMVMSDEVYERITFGNFKFVSFASACPELKDRTVTVNSFSKTYSMTGWRVGYAAGPKEIISAAGRLQSQTTSNVNTFAQYGAIAALNGPIGYLNEVVANYERRLRLGIKGISMIPELSVAGMPEGAFYLFVRIDPSLSDKLPGAGSLAARFVAHILEHSGVAAVPGDAFGDEKYFRISVSSSDTVIEAGVRGISDAINALK